MKINIVDCIDAECYDDYEAIKSRLRPKFNIDYPVLVEDGTLIWETDYGDLNITCEIANVITIRVEDSNENYGLCSSPDIDSTGLVCCVMSALRDYIKDLK